MHRQFAKSKLMMNECQLIIFFLDWGIALSWRSNKKKLHKLRSQNGIANGIDKNIPGINNSTGISIFIHDEPSY